MEPTWSAIHTNPFELVSLHFPLVTSAFKRNCLRTVFCGGLPDVAVHSECRPRSVVAATVINQASGIYQMNRQQLLVGSALAENVETKPVTDCRR